MSLEEITKNHGTWIRIVRGNSTVGMSLKKEKEYGKGPFSEHEPHPYWYMIGLNSYEELEEELFTKMDIYSASFKRTDTGKDVSYVNGILVTPKGDDLPYEVRQCINNPRYYTGEIIKLN